MRYRRFLPAIFLFYIGALVILASGELNLNNATVSFLSALGSSLVAAAMVYVLLRPAIDRAYDLFSDALPLAQAGISVDVIKGADLGPHIVNSIVGSMSLKLALNRNVSYEEASVLRHAMWEIAQTGGRSCLLLAAADPNLGGPDHAERDFIIESLTRPLEGSQETLEVRTTQLPIGTPFVISDKEALIVVNPSPEKNLSGSALIVKAPADGHLGERWTAAFDDLWEASVKT